jgi:multidrug resistance efflux pump
VGGGGVLLLGLIAVGVLLALRNPLGAARPDLVLHTVKYGRLELTVIERGALESAKNSDIYCRVKAGNKGSTVASQIKTLLDDGSEVMGDRPLESVRIIYFFDAKTGTWESRPGKGGPDGAAVVEVDGPKPGEKHYADLLVDLDDSGLQEQLKTQKVTVDKAESDKIQAEEAYKITVSQNDSDIKTAETKLELAIIDLMKYTGLDRNEILKPETIARLKNELKDAEANAKRPAMEIAQEDLKKYKSGDYLAALKDNLGQIETAQSDLSQQEDREAWAYRMVKKGYQTASQAQAETSRKDALQLTLNKQTLALDVLVKYTKVSQLTQYLTNNTAAGGNGGFEEMQRALERTKAQAKAKEVRDRTDREAKRSVWEQELAHYKDIVEEIKKCKIYAPQDGMVVYYIPEQARYGGGSQQSIVAQGEPVREGQKLMQIPDLKHMLVNTKVHEALVSKVHHGQKATIRVDSAPDRLLRAEVDTVATVAAQQDWMAADVKVYTTKVAINPEDIEGMDLKPGMSAEVTITIADALDHVLVVPLQAIVGGPEMGSQRTVVVMTPKGPQERQVTVGASNEKIAEVKEGLQEGDEIVLNPKAVLGDKIKVHQPGDSKGPTVTAGKDGEGSPGAKGNGKGGQKGKQGPAPGGAAGPGGAPGAAAGPGGAPGGGSFGNMTPEEQQKARQQMEDRFRQATPEKRKEMLQQMPESFRDRVKDNLKSKGIDVPD